MVTTLPILADIMSDVVGRVNDITQADPDDPFSVYFGFGPENEVSKAIYKSETAGSSVGAIVWLVERGITRKGEDLHGVGYHNIVLAMPTDDSWTMAERVNQNYKPRLLPLYELIVKELKNEKKLSNPYKIEHTVHMLYYWGGGPPNTTNQEKILFDKKIDAILLENTLLRIKNRC